MKRSAKGPASNGALQKGKRSKSAYKLDLEGPVATCTTSEPGSEAVTLVEAATAQAALELLLSPLPLSVFFDCIWEERNLLVKGPGRLDSYQGLFSTAALLEIASQNTLAYTTNVDVVSFDGRERTVHNSNKDGSTEPVSVDDLRAAFTERGRSVRLLHPQRWCGQLARLLSLLETYYGSCVGCNAYLTPPEAQGFAPHFDDVDAFVLQLEGQKRWKLYHSREPSEELPLESSPDFTSGELELLSEVVLDEGDLLYMPRGMIHEARTEGAKPSLHLTISCCQRQSIAALLQEALPGALTLATESLRDLRRSLPLGHDRLLGVVHQDSESPGREALLGQLTALAQSVLNFLPLDAVVDSMQADFQQQRLRPPVPLVDKAACKRSLPEEAAVQLAWPGVARLKLEDNEQLAVYHCLANERGRHAAGKGGGDVCSEPLLFAPGCGPCLEALLGAEEEAVSLANLPDVECEEGQEEEQEGQTCMSSYEVAKCLFEAGVLLVKE